MPKSVRDEVIVQKFGGSSMGSPELIQQVARRVIACRKTYAKIVVVVSAMKGETDRLLGLAHAVSPAGGAGREVDQLLATGEQAAAALLALALEAQGVKAQSFGAAQMRLYTDGHFSRARLKKIDHAQLSSALDKGQVVVATGFQGVDESGNITTLGRGGSDTSAVALAAVLGASACDIYTDVDGVFTADPRICARARKLDTITFDEMLEMASLGSKVLQIRSVELAMNHAVPLRVRSTFSDDPGTLVSNQEPPIERINVVGISHSFAEAKITLRGLRSGSGALATIFTCLAEDGVNVDVIVQNLPSGGRLDVSFTLGRSDIERTQVLLEQMRATLGYRQLELSDDVGKVSIVGVGMMSHPGVAARMFATLDTAKIVPQLITTSEIKVTCVIGASEVAAAVNALHEAFALASDTDPAELRV